MSRVPARPRYAESNAIRSAEIKDGKVKAKDVATGSLTGTQVADESLSLADLVGVDTTVTLSWVVSGDTCQAVMFAVPGAQVGQVVLITPAGNTSTAVLSPAQVSSPGMVTVHVCAVLGSIVSQQQFRVVTLG